MKNLIKYSSIAFGVMIGFWSIIWLSTLAVPDIQVKSQAEMTFETEVKDNTLENFVFDSITIVGDRCSKEDLSSDVIKEITKDVRFDILVIECNGNLFTLKGNK